MFGPLNFNTVGAPTSSDLSEEGVEVDCILCDKKFRLPSGKMLLKDHVYESHNLIIESFDQVANVPKYLSYWKDRLHVISKEELFGDSEKGVYVISDQLEEDKVLRERLHAEKLELVLDQQRKEREANSYARDCLFCHTHVRGSVADYISHLWAKHNLQLGRPDNLVFVDELINTIQKKMNSLLCLYCEKIFKDRNVLKEHMRKKLHKRINPKNAEYDKFYIVNYLGSGHVDKVTDDLVEKVASDSESDNSDWSDWIEDSNCSITCLLCKESFITFDNTLDHMKSQHRFDFKNSTKDLSFYQQVKLVNYIRRQVHRLHCFGCDKPLSSELNMHDHFSEHQDLMPDHSLWDQPEYFFPTYENDFFLCQIDDPHDDSETSSGIDIHCEASGAGILHESECTQSSSQ